MDATCYKAATLGDIAAECKLTKATVSRALSGAGLVAPDTRRRIFQVAERLNYEPNLQARSLAKGRSEFIVLFSAAVFPGVHLKTVESIQARIIGQGYEMPLYGFGTHLQTEDNLEKQASAMRSLRQQRPRAVVCHSVNLQEPALLELERYVESGGILVCYGHHTDLPVDQVVIDYEDIAYRSACHLLDLGHRDIGYFATYIRFRCDYRFPGFCRALRERGVEIREEWIFDGPSFEEGGAWLAERFTKLAKRPTGMVIVNDVAAGIFINEIGRAGFTVPGDVSVIGHDDAPSARYWQPALTTVRHPVEEVSNCVTEMILARLDGKMAAPRHHIAYGELVVRESAAAPRGR